MSRLIILAGAPEKTSLTWDESHLINDVLLRNAGSTGHGLSDASITSPAHARWRQLPNTRDGQEEIAMGEGREIEQGEDGRGAQFFSPADAVSKIPSGGGSVEEASTASTVSTDATSEVLSQFYDHSFP